MNSMVSQFNVRKIKAEDIEQILQINQLANANREKTQEWVNGFNSYRLNAEILRSLIIGYEESQKDIFLVCADADGKVSGYLFAFFINEENIIEHSKKLDTIFGDNIKKLILLEIMPEQILTMSFGFEDFWGKILNNRVSLSFTFGLQIAIHPDYKKRGLGRQLLTQLFEESKERGSSFFISDVELYPSFNLAQFEFLFKKMELKIAGIINTDYTQNKERCALFYKNFVYEQ
jgi:ribosomal protein S18 acetylase RimI-like enzyme